METKKNFDTQYFNNVYCLLNLSTNVINNLFLNGITSFNEKNKGIVTGKLRRFFNRIFNDVLYFALKNYNIEINQVIPNDDILKIQNIFPIKAKAIPYNEKSWIIEGVDKNETRHMQYQAILSENMSWNYKEIITTDKTVKDGKWLTDVSTDNLVKYLQELTKQ